MGTYESYRPTCRCSSLAIEYKNNCKTKIQPQTIVEGSRCCLWLGLKVKKTQRLRQLQVTSEDVWSCALLKERCFCHSKMSDAPQSSLAPPTCVSPLAALETNETTQAKPDDIQYSSETASPLCNETAHDVRNESTTAVDHPVHTHANEGGDHSASEQTISECAH